MCQCPVAWESTIKIAFGVDAHVHGKYKSIFIIHMKENSVIFQVLPKYFPQVEVKENKAPF